jgi:SAM-dependent methyltransferase
MKRETSNLIRFLIEDLLPPIVRDSAIFRAVARVAWGAHIDVLTDFRKRAALLTSAEYEKVYREHPRVHSDTDNSAACIARILADIEGASVCDIGCGTGQLLRLIRKGHGAKIGLFVGVDFIIPEHFRRVGFEFVEAQIEKLPFPEQAFDTVVCTHVLEHILDYRAAICELRRITRKRLLIVVPREREGIYAFNPHFNFFPYSHSFLRAMIPLPPDFTCSVVGRDIYYMEKVSG